MKAMGCFSGGKLVYYPGDDDMAIEQLKRQMDIHFNVSRHALLFDGNRGHDVTRIESGHASAWWLVPGLDMIASLRELGLPWMSSDFVSQLQRQCDTSNTASSHTWSAETWKVCAVGPRMLLRSCTVPQAEYARYRPVMPAAAPACDSSIVVGSECE